jgi:beta-lactam-binding protein with PASTA domain
MRRLLLPAAVFVALTTAAVTYAAGQRLAFTPAHVARQAATVATVVVPDVRHESFVFAKGQLQDAGFAWRVSGRVQGYPANTVVTQSPAPGTKLIDTGGPLITLTLEQNTAYPSRGVPQNASPYPPTADKLAGSN